MANWKYKVQLGDLMGKYEDGELTADQVGKQFAKRLEELPFAKTECVDGWDCAHCVFNNIVDAFKHEINDEDDFDAVLGSLYDFGDQDHRLWVEAFEGRY